MFNMADLVEGCPPYFTSIWVDNTTLSNSTTYKSCVPRLPLGYYTESQYDALFILVTIIGSISFFTSIITLIPYLFIPEKRKWPHSIFAMLFVFTTLLGLHFIFPIAGYRWQWKKLVIDAHTQTYHTSSSNRWCTVDGVWTLISSLGAVLCWLCIDIYLVLRLFKVDIESYVIIRTVSSSHSYTTVLEKVGVWLKMFAQPFIVYSLLFSYLLVVSILTITQNSYQGYGEWGHCFLKNGLYYRLWIGTLLTVALFAIVNTFIILTTFFTATSPMIALYTIKEQWRIFAFRFVFLIAALTVTIQWLVWNARREEVSISIQGWLQCVATTYASLLANGNSVVTAQEISRKVCLSTNPPYIPSYSSVVWSVGIVPLAVTVFPLFFFFQADVLEWWNQFIKSILMLRH